MRHWILILGALAIGLVGCTKSTPSSTSPAGGATPQTQATATAQSAPQPIVVPANATPEQVMNVFLQAWKTGDSATMDSLLTTKAREELTKHQVHVDPLSSPNAVFQVERAQSHATDPNLAYVNSNWTEQIQNEQGQPVEEKYSITWALRHQTNGWRVAGMQMELIPGQSQFVNFENPAEMLQKMAAAQEALNPPAAPATPGAIPPGTSTVPSTVPSTTEIPAAQTAQQPQIPKGQPVQPRIER